MFTRTTAYDKILNLKKRIRGIAGGTSASKTISVLLFLIDYCQTHDNKVVSIVSESFPHLKRGAMRDFLNIMETHGYFNPNLWNKTESTYLFGSTKLEFFSVDQSEKVKGARRDVLFINEANNVSYTTYDQLEVRTKDLILLDWNPVREFWWYTDVMINQDVDFLILTYKDNEALDQRIVDTIESRKDNKQWWRVYGLGLLGEVEGRIYTGWAIKDEVPHNARLWRYGLDFGYSVDPTSIVAVYEYDGGLILDEILYQKGMSNKEIADVLKNHKRALVIGDSAEPKSIDELKGYGINIIGARKGKDSIANGISYVQEQRITMTKSSTNLINEYRNYMWMKDRDDKKINVPNGIKDHLMDSCFIGNTNITTINGLKKIKDIKVGDMVLTRNGYKKVLIKHNNGLKLVNKYRLQLDTHNDIVVICTPDHKIKTNKGWIPISKLTSVYRCYHLQLIENRL